jgi:aminoglycoside phosphotransferase (APT) family kinase protein
MNKLAEGSFNKVFLLTMDTGEETIARIPHPNAGPAHYTTASEVATMHYLRTKLQLPVPHVIAYSCDATNPVGSEYILMERIAGVNLSTKWETLNDQRKGKILDHLAQLQSKLLTVRFSSYGNLYFTADMRTALCASRICTEASPDDSTYCIGPTTESTFWESDRSGNRGPCMILRKSF